MAGALDGALDGLLVLGTVAGARAGLDLALGTQVLDQELHVLVVRGSGEDLGLGGGELAVTATAATGTAMVMMAEPLAG